MLHHPHLHRHPAHSPPHDSAPLLSPRQQSRVSRLHCGYVPGSLRDMCLAQNSSSFSQLPEVDELVRGLLAETATTAEQLDTYVHMLLAPVV